MATLVVHALAPLAAQHAFDAEPRRRIAIAAVFCACWQDLDVATYALELRPPDEFAHGGATHSIYAAAAAAILVTGIAFDDLGIFGRAWRRVAWFLFGAALSHPLLDMVTAGDAGVALLWPFSAARAHLPWKLLPSTELGFDEYLSFWGLLTIANEVLYVVVPIAIVASLVRGAAGRTRVLRGAAGWLVAVVAARLLAPEWFVATVPRVVAAVGSEDAGDPAQIPRDGLPGDRLLTRWDELRAAGLLDRPLSAPTPPWSSSFFPSWFGGEAGRWSESRPRLVWRTLFGFAPPDRAEARTWIDRAAAGDEAAEHRLFTLAPAEKVDLVFGHLDFPAESQALEHSHNKKGHPRYWSGRCNGVAVAALAEPEPFRVVDVIGVDGTHVLFHPNDVKSLLAVAYYEIGQKTLGGGCERVGFDVGATCSMNASVLTLVAANRLGVAKRSFVIDALPTIAKQFYAVASVTIHVVRAPYAPHGEPIDPAIASRVASLVDVELDVVASSTTLSYARADVVEDATHYEHVGLVPVTFDYAATLALDADTTLIGGRWTGDPPDGPDLVFFPDRGPLVDDAGMLKAADRIPWSFVRDLARASADPRPEYPTLDVRTISDR